MSEKTERKEQGRLTKYFKGVRSEIKKVVWPDKEDLVKYTALVILISSLVAFIIFLFDGLISRILSLIIG